MGLTAWSGSCLPSNSQHRATLGCVSMIAHGSKLKIVAWPLHLYAMMESTMTASDSVSSSWVSKDWAAECEFFSHVLLVDMHFEQVGFFTSCFDTAGCLSVDFLLQQLWVQDSTPGLRSSASEWSSSSAAYAGGVTPFSLAHLAF